MSLVNKMLQDLNARNAQEVSHHLPEQVRVMAAPAGSRGPQSSRVLWGVALALVVCAVVWQWDRLQSMLPQPEAPALAARTPPAFAEPDGRAAQQAVDGAALTPTDAAEPVATTLHALNGNEVPPLAEALPPLPPSLALPAVQASGARSTAGSRPAASLQLRVTESLSMLSRLSTQKAAVTAPLQPAPQTPQTPQTPQRQAESPVSGHAAESVGGEAGASAHAPTRRQPEVAAETRGAASAPVKLERIERGERVDERLQRALTLYHQGRVDEAIQKLQELLSTQPRQLEARQALLSMQLEQRHHVEAMQLLSEGLALLPTRSDWAMALARLQVDAGNVQGALATLQSHQPQAQGNADYLGFMGVLQQHLQRHHEAVLSYQAALRLKPREGRWWYALGLSLEVEQQADAAREAFAKARSAGGLTSAMNEVVARRLQAP